MSKATTWAALHTEFKPSFCFALGVECRLRGLGDVATQVLNTANRFGDWLLLGNHLRDENHTHDYFVEINLGCGHAHNALWHQQVKVRIQGCVLWHVPCVGHLEAPLQDIFTCSLDEYLHLNFAWWLLLL